MDMVTQRKPKWRKHSLKADYMNVLRASYIKTMANSDCMKV